MVDFQNKVDKLENIVKKLESEDVDLDKACDYYSEGVKVAADLVKSLKKVEEKIVILKEAADNIIVVEEKL